MSSHLKKLNVGVNYLLLATVYLFCCKFNFNFVQVFLMIVHFNPRAYRLILTTRTYRFSFFIDGFLRFWYPTIDLGIISRIPNFFRFGPKTTSNESPECSGDVT